MPPSDSHRVDDLLASLTDNMLGDVSQTLHDQSIRVERILLEMVRPDPVQPRRVLPESIHLAFHNNRITPTQALRELVQFVQIAARQRGRPFHSVLELLPNGDDERNNESTPTLSPEEQLLHDLVNLAVTIRDDGQVNPLSVVDVSQGVTRLFRIETGERRYWATWLLRDLIAEYRGDGMIPCLIISAKRSSVFRQRTCSNCCNIAHINETRFCFAHRQSNFAAITNFGCLCDGKILHKEAGAQKGIINATLQNQLLDFKMGSDSVLLYALQGKKDDVFDTASDGCPKGWGNVPPNIGQSRWSDQKQMLNPSEGSLMGFWV